MWRNGTGNKAHRSTGPRSHAHEGARAAKEHRKGNAIVQSGPEQTHRMLQVQERAEERAQWQQQMRIDAGPEANRPDRILAIGDRRAATQAADRNVPAPPIH
jgi:hypothetical protein